MAEETPSSQISASIDSPTLPAEDVFSDDFETESLDSDGINSQRRSQRISAASDSRTRSDSSALLQLTTNSSPFESQDEASTNPARISQADSIANGNTFKFGVPGADFRRSGKLQTTGRPDSSAAYRPPSNRSSMYISDTTGPYQGAMGPSHPYAMYPQDTTLNRASTTSSTRSERRMQISTEPPHPSAIYPQLPTTESDSNQLGFPRPPATVIGFPGLRPQQQFTRPLRPNGEGADDIIGPDGHVEHLPPYSRFENATAPIPPSTEPSTNSPRSRPVSETTPSTTTPSTTTPSTTTPSTTTPATISIPIALVDRVESADEESFRFPSSNQDYPINMAAKAAAAGINTQNRRAQWNARSKKRTCCGKFPCWAVLLIAAMALLAGIAGGLVAKFLGHHSDSPNLESPTNHTSTGTDPQIAATASSPDVATITALPSSIPTIPAGDFAILLSHPRIDSPNCIPIDQARTWSCNANSYLALTIEAPAPNRSPLTSTLSLSNAYADTSALRYGPQAPLVNAVSPAALVDDPTNPGLGAAFYFQHVFDKVVLVPLEDMNAAGSAPPASSSSSSSTPATAPPYPPPASVTSPSPVLSSSLTTPSPPSPAYPYPSEIDSPHSGPDGLEHHDAIPYDDRFVLPGEDLWLCIWNSTILDISIFPSHDTTTGANVTNVVDDVLSADATATINPPGGKPTSVPAPVTWPSSLPPPYTKVVKVQERRPSAIQAQPYCQKMRLLSSFQFQPSLDQMGRPTILNLTETPPTLGSKTMSEASLSAKNIEDRSLPRGKVSLASKTQRRSSPDQTCQCLWMDM